MNTIKLAKQHGGMNTAHTIPSLQGTLAKCSKPTLHPNFAKEPSSPSHPNTQKERYCSKNDY